MNKIERKFLDFINSGYEFLVTIESDIISVETELYVTTSTNLLKDNYINFGNLNIHIPIEELKFRFYKDKVCIRYENVSRTLCIKIQKQYTVSL